MIECVHSFSFCKRARGAWGEVKRYKKYFPERVKNTQRHAKERTRVAEKLSLSFTTCTRKKRDAMIQKNYSKETYFANSLSMASAVLFSATQMFVECSP